MSEIVRGLKEIWRLAPILGLFCSSKHTPAAVHHAMHHGLDDFLSCPLKDIDVFPRMQRLLGDREAPYSATQISSIKAQLHRAGLVGESESFLGRLKSALTARELELKGITTDGSALYPEPIREVFGAVPHQICAFHVIAELVKGVLRAVASERKESAKKRGN